jgi:hypothetical protein
MASSSCENSLEHSAETYDFANHIRELLVDIIDENEM